MKEREPSLMKWIEEKGYFNDVSWKEFFSLLLITKDFLISISSRFWIMNYPYSRIWNDTLKEKMKTEKFKRLSAHTAILGNLKIWTSNYPYASFTHRQGWLNVRPSRMTIIRANRKMEEDLMEEMK